LRRGVRLRACVARSGWFAQGRAAQGVRGAEWMDCAAGVGEMEAGAGADGT